MVCSTIEGPDFICVGMAKAGTGWLFEQLKYHPDFWMPPVKEIGFLVREKLKRNAKVRIERLGNLSKVDKLLTWSNRQPGDDSDLRFLEEMKKSIRDPLKLDSYASLFRFKRSALSGDITPGYCALEPDFVSELVKRVPKTKVMLMVRDPVDRAWSHICMWIRAGKFGEDLLESGKAFRSILNSERFQRNSYASEVVRIWKERAPEIEFQAFMFDDLVKSPEEFRRSILLYLGADPDKETSAPAPSHNSKAQAKKLELTEPIRVILIEHLRDELRACADLFGAPAQCWAARYGV